MARRASDLTAGRADGSAPLANALTVDLEEHFQVSGFEDVVSREDWDRHPSRVSDNTLRLLDVFGRHDARATFFVLGWVAERHPALVRRIADAGHEIACHGYSHRLIYTQRPDDFRDEMVRARRILQDASSQAVIGHRAASFSITRRNLWALDVLAEAGFTYDSSIFPVVHDRYGVPGAPRGFYRVRTPDGSLLDEAPPSTVAIAGLVLPVAGGGYLRLYPLSVTRWAIRRLNARDGLPAVVYLHPWEVDPEQPRIDGVPLLRRFRHYVNLSKTLGRLEALLAGHPFDRLDAVLAASGPLPLRSVA